MVRDFTEATLKEITDCCKITQGEMEDIEVDFNDPNGPLNAMFEYMGGEDILGTERENLLYHYHDLIYQSYYNASAVEERFAAVRKVDEGYGDIFADQKAEALDHYITSMKALVDSIRVGAPGTPSMTDAQLNKAKESYASYGSVDMEYGSIFTSGFQLKLNEVGDGAITPTFNTFFKDDGSINWERIDKMMEEGATGWEIAALSKLLDTYMKNSEELGIDMNGYAEFFDHCYIRQPWAFEDDYDRYQNGGLSLHDYDRYSLSDTVIDLMLYRQNVTEKTLTDLGMGYGNSNSKQDDNKVRYDCFISDSLMMICNYYDCIEVQRERFGHLLYITGEVGDEKLDNITIEVLYMKDHFGENEWEVKPITIYLFDRSIISNFDDALNNTIKDREVDEDQKVIIAGIEIMKGLAMDTAGSVVEDTAIDFGVDERFYGGSKEAVDFGIDFFGLSQVREEARKHNQQCEGLISAIEYKGILTDVAAGGTVCQYGEDILINNRTINERSLLLRINYYNAETESELTLEQIEQQLRNYEFSNGNTEELDKFCDFVDDEGLITSEADDDYEQYKVRVDFALNDMDTDRMTATREQLEAACRIATDD